ncbi:MAG: YraN family protein [Pseudomonadota bacterium]
MAFRTGSFRQRLGWQRENQALSFLKTQGLTLVTRNFTCRAGEIDLVMNDGPTLVSVEVRYRSGRSHGGAIASITTAKQQRWVRATEYLVASSRSLAGRCVRFDVVALDGKEPRIVWLQDVLRLDGR